MSELYKVEDNVPMPGGRRYGLTEMLRNLKPGQSFAFEESHRGTTQTMARKITNKTGKKFSFRSISLKEARVWCVSEGESS
jgi:hypothetical protein